MRLGQLARKLSLRPAQLVEFLATHNIQMEESSNARMDDTHVELIVRHYAPESLTQIVEEIEEPELAEEIPQPSVIEPATIEAESDGEEKQEPEPQVIRVQKIELSGLKVLGKIELPELRKKETEPTPTEEGQEPATLPENPPVEQVARPRNQNKKQAHQRPVRAQQRPWKNPLELKRERETREAEEKKRKAQQQEKEKRKRHYEQKVKSVGQPKRAKPVKQQAEVRKKPVDTRPVPKTWFGKFLRWWTT
jgi:hypothetical protein